MIVDFRRGPCAIPDLCINGVKVERVNEYKYLGTILDSKLTFDTNTQSIHKRCQSRLFCLKKLRSLGVNESILGNFYRCFLESVLTFGFLCWYSGLSVRNKNVLDRVVKVSGKVVGVRQRSMHELYESRIASKARMILCDASHVLAKNYELLPSGRRYRHMKASTNRAKMSLFCQQIY